MAKKKNILDFRALLTATSIKYVVKARIRSQHRSTTHVRARAISVWASAEMALSELNPAMEIAPPDGVKSTVRAIAAVAECSYLPQIEFEGIDLKQAEVVISEIFP